ncbi:MAG: glutamyl-tRNA reductase [Dongiaceae bacterium]
MQKTGDRGDAESRRLVLVGASFRTVAPALRERLFLDDEASARLGEALCTAGIAEALVLPTCDRLELYAAAGADEWPRLRTLLAQALDLDSASIARDIYIVHDDAAVAQLFAVAAALDSAVPGEAQVLGQLKESHRRARDAGAIGPLLEPLLQAAYGCAKRVRTETALAQHPVSMVTVARNVARRLHGDLAQASALLIGLGDMGLMLAEALRAGGLTRLTVMHPSPDRAAALARQLGCHYRPESELAAALEAADIAISAMGLGRVVLTASVVENALVARRRRPMLLLDAAIPGDIEPAAGSLDDAFLYGMDDLDRLAQDGLTSRQAEAAAARAIVAEAASAYRNKVAARETAPALGRLRERFEQMRAEILAVHGADADEATRRLLNRVLHDPALALRRLAAGGEGPDAERWLERLFATDENDAAPDDADRGAKPEDKDREAGA